MQCRHERHDQAGLTLIEVLVATAVALFFAMAVLQFVTWSRRTYVAEADQANSQSVGRAILEVMALELRNAGYDPMGVLFTPLPSGNANSVRLLADLDEDGVVGTSTEVDENVTYVFSDANGDGLFDLRRGFDFNGDGDFLDTGESIETVVTGLVPVDLDENGTADPFIVYDTGSAATATRLTLTFGIQSDYIDVLTKTPQIVSFQSAVILRNVLWS